MSQGRSRFTVDTLGTGQILVAGGCTYDGEYHDLVSAELFTPTTNTWTVTGSLLQARATHASVMLPSGKVLVVAGSGLTSSEQYDPGTGVWTLGGNLAQGRWYPAAALITTRVLVSGWAQPVELVDGANGSIGSFAFPVTGLVETRFQLLGASGVLASGGHTIGGNKPECTLVKFD